MWSRHETQHEVPVALNTRHRRTIVVYLSTGSWFILNRLSEPSSIEIWEVFLDLKISDEIKFISENFESGKSADYIKKGYRTSIVKSHIIFYKKSGRNIVETISVLHQKMDIENRIDE